MAAPVSNFRSVWPMFFTGLVLLALFLVANALLRLWGPSGSQLEAERGEARVKNLAELQAANDAVLTKFGWVDKAKGTVHIPISRAMELEMAALNGRKPAPAYPVVVVPDAAPAAPAAPATATPATSTAPAAPAAPATSPAPTTPAAPATPAQPQPAVTP